jgi:hypothetical protein
MHIRLEINKDFVCFIGHPKILRPLRISRARWLTFWDFMVQQQSVTVGSMQSAEKFLRGQAHDKAFDY